MTQLSAKLLSRRIMIVCLMILGLFAFVTLRAMSRASKETSLFITLAATGLGVQFGLQAAINMASTIQLIPAKGMTLPFISYGGSSMISLAYGMGMLLALSRERPRSDYLPMGGLAVAGSPA